MNFRFCTHLPGVALVIACVAWGHPFQQDEKPSKQHFVFLDHEFVFTVELVKEGIPILNFINLGKRNYFLQASAVRIISGIKLYRPQLFDVETALNKDPLRVSAMKIHSHSSFGVTLIGGLSDVTKMDRVTIRIGQERFEFQSISAEFFNALSEKITQINLLSPDIRDDFRVLDIRPMGQRRRLPS